MGCVLLRWLRLNEWTTTFQNRVYKPQTIREPDSLHPVLIVRCSVDIKNGKSPAKDVTLSEGFSLHDLSANLHALPPAVPPCLNRKWQFARRPNKDHIGRIDRAWLIWAFKTSVNIVIEVRWLSFNSIPHILRFILYGFVYFDGLYRERTVFNSVRFRNSFIVLVHFSKNGKYLMMS